MYKVSYVPLRIEIEKYTKPFLYYYIHAAWCISTILITLQALRSFSFFFLLEIMSPFCTLTNKYRDVNIIKASNAFSGERIIKHVGLCFRRFDILVLVNYLSMLFKIFNSLLNKTRHLVRFLRSRGNSIISETLLLKVPILCR